MHSTVFVQRKRLDDGSHVFNVAVPRLDLAAYDEKSAQDFATSLAILIDRYTVNATVDVKYDY